MSFTVYLLVGVYQAFSYLLFYIMDLDQIQGISPLAQMDDFPNFSDLDVDMDPQFDPPVSILCAFMLVYLYLTDITTVDV